MAFACELMLWRVRQAPALGQVGGVHLVRIESVEGRIGKMLHYAIWKVTTMHAVPMREASSTPRRSGTSGAVMCRNDSRGKVGSSRFTSCIRRDSQAPYRRAPLVGFKPCGMPDMD